MSDKFYSWKRFWCPRSGSISLSDGGFLYDPDFEYGNIRNPHVVSFDKIADIPCLVLLGEPGIGKSMAMNTQRDLIERLDAETGATSLWIDLRAYQSDTRLCQAIFEHPVFRSWLDGYHVLYLFLDSLDECLLRINAVASILIDEFRKYPCERLFLRIGCRTADWPYGLETGLRQIWGKEVVDVFELAPLRRVDVIEAAITNSIEPEIFLHEIERREAVPLAIKPVTLQFLINVYLCEGQFPSTQIELYYRGCNLLCAEPSQSRRDARLTGSLSSEQRMAVAARISAVTVFANRYAVWMGLDTGDVPEEDIIINHLYGRSEIANGIEFPVTEDAVRETLGTGLFTSRGPDRMGWAHQTYAEFLAARYLVEHQLETVQILSLITHPGDPEGKIVPQLQETAAWLASMLPVIFREIMKVDPEILLRSDVATADGKDREALAKSLLIQFDEEKLVDFDFDLQRRYSKLFHPRLGQQLKPYIQDSDKGFMVRRVAIDIAESCQLKELQQCLVDIALDHAQDLKVRVDAAHAVCIIGDDESKVQLKPLAFGDVGDDPEDELKGCGLEAVWPANMSAEELFSVLTMPRQSNLYGLYKAFIRNKIMQHIQPQDIPIALRWLEGQPSGHGFSSTFNDLKDALMLMAWDHLEWPGVLESFARAVLCCFYNYEGIVLNKPGLDRLRNELIKYNNKRHSVVEAIISINGGSEDNLIQLISCSTPLVHSEDISWLIKCLLSAKSEVIQQSWAYLIYRVVDVNYQTHTEIIYEVCGQSPVLSKICAPLFKPVVLESPEANKTKDYYYQRQKWNDRQKVKPLIDPPLDIRISKLLDDFEKGDLNAWWMLNLEMTLKPDSTHYCNEFESDLTKLPGWQIVDSKTRERIVAAARNYVLEKDPDTKDWLGTNIFYRPAFAGYRALLLLVGYDQNFINTLPATIWAKWAPVVLAFPVSSGIEDEGPHHLLVKLAYLHAPEQIIKTLMELIDKENQENNHIFITRKVTGFWDNIIAGALLEKAKDPELQPQNMGCLLRDLIQHKDTRAVEYAYSLIYLSKTNNETERRRSVIAASILMCHAEGGCWPVLWPVIQQDNAFGREVIFEVASNEDHHHASIALKLDEERLADLFIWLVRQFPYSGDPVHDDAHWVQPRDSVSYWRNSILNHLKNRGTYEACNAIQRILLEFPELDWLKWTLLEAKINARRQTWIPHQPVDVLKIVTNHQLRLVNSGDQLLEVLLESLKRLEGKLQGETPASIDLWNDNPYRPKDENRFSDYVKRHFDEDLRQRGIVFNREVEIRRGTGGRTGERTDIHVDALRNNAQGNAYDIISSIIEVKGSWHPELRCAMKTQLLDRYLKDNQCQHGLYLVGWFNCNQWDDTDRRKSKVPNMDISEAQIVFNKQAAELAQYGVAIKAFVLNASI